MEKEEIELVLEKLFDVDGIKDDPKEMIYAMRAAESVDPLLKFLKVEKQSLDEKDFNELMRTLFTSLLVLFSDVDASMGILENTKKSMIEVDLVLNKGG